MTQAISVRGLRVIRGERSILDGIDLDIPGQGVTGFVGPNGSGKTTALRCLSGSLRPDAGAVRIAGKELGEYSARELARTVAVVTQEHDTDIPLSCAELVMLGRLPYDTSRARDEEIVAASLRSMGAMDLARRSVQSLSGGERQRVLIARGLAQQAPFLLLDEPTNHLDVRYQYDLLDLLSAREGATAVVLHDLNLAARYCDHLIVLNEGRVHTVGAPSEVLVSEVLEPVYQVPVTRAEVRGRIVLLFNE